ncbi:MAG: hypothetical protein A2046_05765 [Bacteroidetes bacterium GWA2_30_7]|nr:MAG: hypothetical protein A2046_05765 [Bacteroidetes bacterium GWA2_30_7]
MESNIRTISIIISLIAVSILNSFSQQKINFNNAVNWTLKEKFKFTYEQLQNTSNSDEAILNDDLNKELNYSKEQIVSKTSEVEAEIHAAINPIDSNNIVISPIRQNFTNAKISCPIYYSKNFGSNWNVSSFQNMPYKSGMISGGGGDPVFAFDANGRLYFSWIDLYGSQSSFLFGNVNMGIFWAYSDDGGTNWIKPNNDTILLGKIQMFLGSPSKITSPISDKQWMAVDKTNNQFRNNLYVCFVTISQNGNDASYQINCKTKPSNSDKFTISAKVSDISSFSFVQFSSLVVDSYGNVHVIFYGTKDGSTMALWHSVSVNGGVSFSSPNIISNLRFNLPILEISPEDLIPGIDNNRLYPSPYIASDPNNGNVYVTWTAFGIDGNNGKGSEIFFSRSSDNGISWTAPIVVNDDHTARHNYYSSIVVKKNSDIKISWYDRRNDTSNIKSNYYYTTSKDFGNTFEPNSKITSVETDFSKIGSKNQNFGIGEYTQLLASDNYTIPIWCDGRTNDGNIKIYAAFINDLTSDIVQLSSIDNEIEIGDVYPNPSSSKINFELKLKRDNYIHVKIIDNNSKTICDFVPFRHISGNQYNTIDVSDIPNGIYYLIIESEFGLLARKFNICR